MYFAQRCATDMLNSVHWTSLNENDEKRNTAPSKTAPTQAQFNRRNSVSIQLLKQGDVLMGRNRTGPPCSVGRPTVHAPGGWPADTPAALQTTYDNRRRQIPTTVASLPPYTMCRRASNNISYFQEQTARFRVCTPVPRGRVLTDAGSCNEMKWNANNADCPTLTLNEQWPAAWQPGWMARGSQFYLPPTRLSTNGTIHLASTS